MSDHWFKPKTHGYGASPANWKGWVAIAGFVLVIHAITWPWILTPVFADELPQTAGIVATFVLIAAATIAFIWFCKVKTNGAWAWRWGDKK